MWLFHFHVLWHLANEMAMMVDVMGDQRRLNFAGAECNVPMGHVVPSVAASFWRHFGVIPGQSCNVP